MTWTSYLQVCEGHQLERGQPRVEGPPGGGRMELRHGAHDPDVGHRRQPEGVHRHLHRVPEDTRIRRSGPWLRVPWQSRQPVGGQTTLHAPLPGKTTLKRKCHNFDEICVIGCTESCHNDNFQCSQGRQFRQKDISIPVNVQNFLPGSLWISCGIISKTSFL